MIYFKDFSEKELRALQLKLTDILNDFDDFCKKNGLTYFLAGGTCLGAVRHQGFIPWDDDVDVCLPRKDYEQLTKLWNKQHPDGKYVLYRPNKDILTGVHITLIKDSTTTCVYPYSEKYNICQGIKIDVEVLDGAPKGKIAQLQQTFFSNLYGLFAAQRVPISSQPTWKKVIARIVLPLFKYQNLCYRIFSFADKQVSKYEIEDCKLVKRNYGPNCEKDIFFPVSELSFEGRLRPVPRDYDRYLKLVYKDYMTLPPEGKRYPISKVLAFDLNHSYEEYRKINDRNVVT